MAQTKSNLSKKSITNKPKIKNKKVNKLELTVKLHENFIKTKIKALVAGGFEVDVCSVKCQWDGLNYSTLWIWGKYIIGSSSSNTSWIFTLTDKIQVSKWSKSQKTEIDKYAWISSVMIPQAFNDEDSIYLIKWRNCIITYNGKLKFINWYCR